jgi:hypothetical protein
MGHGSRENDVPGVTPQPEPGPLYGTFSDIESTLKDLIIDA